ncbi:hypothetical protein [Mesorhizobium huakuii]|uniref:Uncharacterized protein n=1 Tax=Mesorhizobium huakuii TaxID=28104 RepID=A0A7G6SUP2_9HYPH|nr:hypothetical protein [Mesorhizobium huakuii]QND58224.1 hypothetical protein HB778_17720 [Mesorhizobium huakuii]
MTLAVKLAGMLKAAKSASVEVTEGLDALRAEISDLKAKRNQVESTPVPKQEALKRLDAFLAQLGERAERFFYAQVFTQREDYRPPAILPSNMGEVALGFAAPLLRERVAALISESYGTGDGPSTEAHRQIVTKLDADIFELELAEEALVRNAEAAGIEILRRADADPRAVLASDDSLPSL